MKRIITCSDGTWNAPNVKEQGKSVRTNVQKIFDFIERRDPRGIPQVKYYDEGVGAQGNLFTRLFNGATGKGIDENIVDVYKFISWNYVPGDELYLFGFSRGAYTARSLAGMIRKCGILRNNDLSLVAEAYRNYRDHGIHPDELDKFRKEHSYEVNIKFIGVWDTVGSLGIPLHSFQWYNKKKYQFHDVTLSSIVDHAYHALALDERRANFKPSIWEQSPNAAKRATPQVLEQRWFPGVHSNVGGGYPDEGLADQALQWMIDRAGALGLAFDPQQLKAELKPDHKGVLYDSKSGIFKYLPDYVRPLAGKPEAYEVLDDSITRRKAEVRGYVPKQV